MILFQELYWQIHLFISKMQHFMKFPNTSVQFRLSVMKRNHSHSQHIRNYFCEKCVFYYKYNKITLNACLTGVKRWEEMKQSVEGVFTFQTPNWVAKGEAVDIFTMLKHVFVFFRLIFPLFCFIFMRYILVSYLTDTHHSAVK